MRRFLNKLLRDFRTTGTARGGRQAPHRATPQVEGLEDRLVMTTGVGLQQFGSTLDITASQNQTLTFQGFGVDGMQVLDQGNVVYRNLNKQSLSTVNITVEGADSVIVDDSNGMPFAQNTAIKLLGSGSNKLTLEGSRGIGTDIPGLPGITELYVVGGTASTVSTVELDNLTFSLSNAIAQVNDSLQIADALDVATAGQHVALSDSSSAHTQTLSGMGPGGGSTLVYMNKPDVFVSQFAANATDFLDATAAAAGEHSFAVNMHGAGDSTTIDQTPSNVVTSVAPVGNNESVAVWGNAAPVIIGGNSSTQVSIGFPLGNGLETTRGIQANVAVEGTSSSLSISDTGNVSTPENVTVTESTIFGSGLFANSGVTVSYSGVGTLDLFTGQAADDYTLIGSHSGATFTSRINIFDFSRVSFTTDAIVDSGSQLHVQLFNESTPVNEAQLFIEPAAGGTVTISGTPNGVADVFFSGQLSSQLAYSGFGLVEAI